MKISMYDSKSIGEEFLDHNDAGYEETFKRNKLPAVPGDKIL